MVVAARTSCGKSTFALQLAYGMALLRKRVLFLSLEMTVEDMLERLFCYEYRINNQELIRGNFSKYADKFETFSQEIKTLPFVLSDCIGNNWQEVDKLLSALNPKPDVLFIDHINAIKTSGGFAKDVIDDYLNNIVAITKHNNISTVLCCQINRDNQKDDDKTPQLHELKGSGNIEECCDQAVLLHWPYRYAKEGEEINKNKYIAIVAKNRNGPTGYIELNFEPEYYSFSDAKEEQSVVDQLNVLVGAGK